MVAFKHKNTKKIVLNAKKTTTLDSKHNEFVDEFNDNNNNKIPSLISKKDLLKKFKSGLDNKSLSVEEILDLKEQIKEINKEIKNIKKRERLLFNKFKYYI